jgi:hypothetical protein
MKKFVMLCLLTLPLAAIAGMLLDESFDDGLLGDWTRDPGTIGQRWGINSQHYYDPDYGLVCEEGDAQDERVISPTIQLGSANAVSFYWATSYTWFVSPHDNGDYSLEIRDVDYPAYWEELWNENAEGTFENWTWYQTTVVVPESWNGREVQFAWRVVADDAADVWLDLVTVYDDYHSAVEESSFGQIKAMLW